MTGMSFGRSFYGLVPFYALFHIKEITFVYHGKSFFCPSEAKNRQNKQKSGKNGLRSGYSAASEPYICAQNRKMLVYFLPINTET